MLETGTQRDEYLQELVQTDALLESAIQHNDVQEVERLRVKIAIVACKIMMLPCKITIVACKIVSL